MKTSARHSSALVAVVLAALLAFPFASSAAELPVADPAAQALSRHGQVAVTAVGDYVELGTFRVQVSAKLGRPDVTLADGTWLYQQRQITGSNATGTLVVQFTKGRVSALTLATPAAVAALRKSPATAGGSQLVAAK